LNVTKTLAYPTHDFLSGAQSAHAVEPTTPVALIANTGDFVATGSGAKAAASLSASLELVLRPRLSAFPTFDPLRVEGGRLIEP
jgi:hypothetical protein